MNVFKNSTLNSPIKKQTRLFFVAFSALLFMTDFAVAQTMSYTSSNTIHQTCPLYQGATDQQLMQISVVTTGNASPLTLTAFNLNTNGTTNANDIGYCYW